MCVNFQEWSVVRWCFVFFQDLLRTMPSNACYCNIHSTGIPRLRRILRGLAWLFPDIGYCQGTGVVGSIVLYKKYSLDGSILEWVNLRRICQELQSMFCKCLFTGKCHRCLALFVETLISICRICRLTYRVVRCHLPHESKNSPKFLYTGVKQAGGTILHLNDHQQSVQVKSRKSSIVDHIHFGQQDKRNWIC